MHVRGFTVAVLGRRRTRHLRGLIEKIPYLKELGVTAVELLPIYEFDETRGQRTNPSTGEPLHNYWGYNTIGFFAPKRGYCATPDAGSRSASSATWSRPCTQAGIEVILDVVFNHTAEGDDRGPTSPSAASTTASTTTCSRPTGVLHQLHRLRQHAQLQPPDRPRS